MNNYYVIGGQYQFYSYGGTPTLLGAKRLANKHVEYWDNWQGWHTPSIYRAEDTYVAANGERYPAMWAAPVDWRTGKPIDC